MKKFLSIILVMLGIIFGIQNFVYAESIKIYDGNIKDIISNLEIDCENFNTNIYNLEYYNQAAFIQGSIEKSIGLSKSETYELGNKFREAFQNFGRNNSNAHHYHEKFSVWCSKTNRYIVLDVEMDDAKFDWYIYAYR